MLHFSDARSKLVPAVERLQFPTFVGLFFVLTFLIPLPWIITMDVAAGPQPQLPSEPFAAESSQSMQVLLLVVVVPLVETLIFQKLVITLLKKWLSHRRDLMVLVAAAIFAAFHGYSWSYTIYSFTLGFVFSAAYILRDRPLGFPTTTVVTIHALRNLTYFVV
jgi:uncharacterized protein